MALVPVTVLEKLVPLVFVGNVDIVFGGAGYLVPLVC